MADVPSVSYITEDEVKAQTAISGLAALETPSITLLIQTAEDQIDAYVGPQPHHPRDENLDRVFPREQDFSVVGSTSGFLEYPDIPEIPYKISRACLRQVEWLYTQWWPSRDTDALPAQYPVEQQSIGGDGSYSETRARGGINFSEASLCDQAKLLLTGFVSRTAALGVTDVNNSVPARLSNGSYAVIPYGYPSGEYASD